MAQHYKDLIAWQKAMDLVVEIYATTEQFPSREKFSLTDQIRRAAVSVPSNIAEGQAHYSHREFLHFLRHSRGSLAELETQILIAEREPRECLRKRSEEHTSELQSPCNLVCRLLLEKKKRIEQFCSSEYERD